MNEDDLEKLKEELNAEPYKNNEDRYKPISLLKEFAYSFIISLIPAFVSIVFYIVNHENATKGEAGWWLLESLFVGTVIIFLFRISIPRRILRKMGIAFLFLLFAVVIFFAIFSIIACSRAEGSIGYYHRSEGVVRDIDGDLVTQIGRNGFLLDTVCYISEEKVKDVKNSNYFFNQFTTFIVETNVR